MKKSLTPNMYLPIIFVQIIVSYFSIGFLHPDEQYYALDFTFYKLGLLQEFTPSWEYQEQIRPWSLPFFFFLISTPLKIFNITNPFIYSEYIRIVSSAISMSIYYFSLKWIINKLSEKISSKAMLFCLSSWPILYMNARTSSDNLSTSIFIGATVILFSHKTNFHLIASSALMVFAFYLRFQTALLIVPVLFLYFIENKNIRQFSIYSFISLMTIGLFHLIDYWGYGEFSFTPWNYLKVNLIEKKVNNFGIEPVWYYFAKAITKLPILWGIGTVFIFSYLLKNYKEQTHKRILLIVLPFLIIHHLIGHKELRFIFPVFVLLIPFLFIYTFKYKKLYSFIFYTNLISILFILKPAYSPMKFYKELYNLNNVKKIYYLTETNPLELKSYLRTDLKVLKLDKNSGTQPFTLITQNKKEYHLAQDLNCHPHFLSYPEFFIKNDWFKIASRSNIWGIFTCPNNSTK